MFFGLAEKKVWDNYISDIQIKQSFGLSAKNHLDTAITHLNRSILLNDKNVDAYYQRGFIFFNKDLIRRALDDYQRVQKLAPNYVNVNFNMASCYYRMRNYEDAIRMAGISLRLYPDYEPPIMMLANCYYYIQKPKIALEYCKLLLRKNPKHLQAIKLYHHLERIFESNGFF